MRATARSCCATALDFSNCALADSLSNHHHRVAVARRLPRFGASSSSLHAKVFILDRRRVFIGSFNLDPRSLYLNCEMGLMIESPKLAERISRQMDHLIEERSYHPFIALGNRLSWRDTEGNEFRMEPESTVRQRVFAWIISWLPVNGCCDGAMERNTVIPVKP